MTKLEYYLNELTEALELGWQDESYFQYALEILKALDFVGYMPAVILSIIGKGYDYDMQCMAYPKSFLSSF
jgi:hypothetical protein